MKIFLRDNKLFKIWNIFDVSFDNFKFKFLTAKIIPDRKFCRGVLRQRTLK